MVRRLALTFVLTLLLGATGHAHNGEDRPPPAPDPFPRTPQPTDDGGPIPGGGRPTPRPSGRSPSGGPGPANAPPAGRTTGSTSRAGWIVWWHLNRDAWLEYPATPREASPVAAGAGATAASEEPQRVRAAALAALREAVKSKDEDLATSALVALGKAGDPADLPLLVAIAEDAERPVSVRESAMLAIGLCPSGDDRLRALAARLADSGEGTLERAAAAISLGLLGDAAAVPALLAASAEDDSRPDVASAAALGLGLVGDPMVAPDLCRDLVGPAGSRISDDRRRSVVAAALGKLGGDDARAALRVALRDPADEVRRQAVLSLSALTGPDDRESFETLLRALATEKDGETQGLAAVGVGAIGDADAADVLLRVYRGAQTAAEPYAALGLGLLARKLGPDDPRAERIASFLRTEFVRARHAERAGALATALALARDASAERVLRKRFAEERDHALQARIACALGMLGAKGAAPEIRRALEEPIESDLLREAGVAFGLLDDAPGRARLVELAREGTTLYTRGNAALALGRASRLASAGPLVEILNDPDERDFVKALAAMGLGVVLERAARPRPLLLRLDAHVCPTTPVEAIRRALDVL